MTSNEAIRKIKVLLGIEKFEATATLMDGTPVHVDTDFEVGAALHIVQEDGTFLPAPEGEHTLTDGRTLYVDAAGIITAVEEAAVEEAETPAEEAPATTEEAMDEVVVEDVPAEVAPVTEEIVSAVVEAIAPVLEEVTALKAQLEALSGRFNKFSNEPAAKPVRNNFAEEAKSAAQTAEARVKMLAKIRNNKK